MKRSLGPQTLPMPAPVWVIGTYDQEGKPNIMTAAWAGICCSKPPCVTVSLRKATYTYGNIVAKQAYTVNIPGADQVKEADLVGIVSGRDQNKFERAGLTPVRSELVDAPLVEEFPVAMECRVLHTLEIGLHTQFVAEVLDVKVELAAIRSDGMADAQRVDPLVFVSGEYRSLGPVQGKPFSSGKEL